MRDILRPNIIIINVAFYMIMYSIDIYASVAIIKSLLVLLILLTVDLFYCIIILESLIGILYFRKAVTEN